MELGLIIIVVFHGLIWVLECCSDKATAILRMHDYVNTLGSVPNIMIWLPLCVQALIYFPLKTNLKLGL